MHKRRFQLQHIPNCFQRLRPFVRLQSNQGEVIVRVDIITLQTNGAGERVHCALRMSAFCQDRTVCCVIRCYVRVERHRLGCQCLGKPQFLAVPVGVIRDAFGAMQ